MRQNPLGAAGTLGLLALQAWSLAGCARPDGPHPTPAPAATASTPEPAILLPGVLSAPGVSRAYVTFAPDGRTLYVARYEEFGGDRPVAIQVSRREGEVWSIPRTTAFSNTTFDHQPCVSPDGRHLYFVSRRPVNGQAREDSEIWRVAIAGDGWGEPEHLAALGGPANEYAPFVARSGRIYFSSDRDGGLGSGDLYVAEPEGAGFGPPRNLGAPVNGPSGEWGSTVDADESLLVFESSDRSANLSESGDLYLSRRVDGVWETPRHLAPPINSPASDLAPRLSSDGRFLDFSTNRNGVVETLRVPLDSLLGSAP